MSERARQSGSRRRGLTLAELLVALVVVGACAAAMATLLTATLRTATRVDGRDQLLRQAEIVLARIVGHVRETDIVFLPNAKRPGCPVVAINLGLDNDNDGKIDEDPARGGAGAHGVAGQDDDGDGQIDEGAAGDADEDGSLYEDPKNGVDDDGDGLIDEDFPADANADGAPGELNQDDDGDGDTDEGDSADDDEDGLVNEDGYDPVVYSVNDDDELIEVHPTYGTNVLAEGVSEFLVTMLVDAHGTAIYEITLELADGNGNRVRLTTRAFPRGQQGS